MAEACRIYLITPPRLEPEEFRNRLAAALDAGDVACVQLRLKDEDDDALRRAIETLMPECRTREVALLVNDRPDIAAEMEADGAHIGAEDADYMTARKLVGPDKLVGVSCYDSRHMAMEAAEAGADYVAFGAFFPTETKRPPARAPIELLEWWSDLMVVPCVAIGGITAENCAPLVRAGADFLAVISAVWDHPDGPAAGINALDRAIAQAQGS